MRGLEPPPKEETAGRLVGRMVVLIVLLGAAAAAIFSATTNQRIDLTEDVRTIGLELEDTNVVDGIRVNVTEDAGGPLPVVILHDDDVTGSVPLAGLSESLGSRYHGVRIDLAGFGYSDRLPSEGPKHTAAGQADTVAGVLEQRFSEPVLVIGIGFGGEVGADLALTYPHLVEGLVMVDTDFWARGGFTESLQRLPWVGRTATYTWETGGRFALDNWSPYCEDGGWCPTPAEASARSSIIMLANTTDSLYSFRRTQDAALAPSNLEDIEPPVAYVWSTEGPVSDGTIERMGEGITDLFVVESDTFQAQFEDFGSVVNALVGVDTR